MKILITGAKGFVGKNFVTELINRNYMELYEFDIDSNPELLDSYCSDCDFVYHLAGVNRPKEQIDFMTGNFGFTSIVLDSLRKQGNKCPIMISSSTQAALDNPYGMSKRAGEELMFEYAKETGVEVFVYRLPNVFGKGCLPNYNSAVATFCYNIANDLPIQVNDRSVEMNLVYIDDLVNELISVITGKGHKNLHGYCYVPEVHIISLGAIVDLLYSFHELHKEGRVLSMNDTFTMKLYDTYKSYLIKK